MSATPSAHGLDSGRATTNSSVGNLHAFSETQIAEVKSKSQDLLVLLNSFADVLPNNVVSQLPRNNLLVVQNGQSLSSNHASGENLTAESAISLELFKSHNSIAKIVLQNTGEFLSENILTCEVSAASSSVIALEGLLRSLESIPKVRSYDSLNWIMVLL